MRRLVSTAALLLATLQAVPASALVWPNAVERAQRALESDDVSARRRAASALTRLPEAAARRLAAHALGDEDVEVRLLAIAAAETLHVDGLGRRVIGWLTETDARLRRAAAWTLRLEPTTEANAALGRALSDADVSVRLAAAEALGDAESADATLPLLGRLDDAHPEVRLTVVRSLARVGDARAVVPLIGKAQDNVEDVRREVARALGSLGDGRAVPALVLQLRDREESVRLESVRALGRLGVADGVVPLAALLADEAREPVRVAAYDALGRIAAPAGVDVLFEWLGREEASSVDAVADALAAAGDEARERSRACLRGQPATTVGDGCARALATSGDALAAQLVADALRRGVVSPRAALEAIERIGDAAALPTVLERIVSSDPAVREAAMAAAAALLDPAASDGRAVQPLVHALNRSIRDRRDRLALVALLGRTGSPLAAPALVPLLTSADDPSLRRVAARALGSLPSREATAALLEALDDEAPEVRLEAAVALGRSATGVAGANLLRRYEDAPRQDRGALAVALAGAAARASRPRFAGELGRLVRARRGAERDALIDALAAVPGEPGSRPLQELLDAGVEPATRAKVAEALGAHPEAAKTLWRLADDPDGAVRANAVWSLGRLVPSSEAARIVARLSDRDPAVAGNAAGALALLGQRGAPVRDAVCAALSHRHPYVRANAARGVALLGTRCDPAAERRMLARDPSPVARAAAAMLVASLPPASRDRRDADALSRCVSDEPSGAVAAACLEGGVPSETGTQPVTVYVVPEGGRRPVARAPFALVRPDGLLRLGLADRRGAVRELDVPRGELRLEVPAPLALP